MKMKYAITLLAAVIAVLLFNTTLHNSSTDKQIESSAKESYVLRTY